MKKYSDYKMDIFLALLRMYPDLPRNDLAIDNKINELAYIISQRINNPAPKKKIEDEKKLIEENVGDWRAE